MDQSFEERFTHNYCNIQGNDMIVQNVKVTTPRTLID